MGYALPASNSTPASSAEMASGRGAVSLLLTLIIAFISLCIYFAPLILAMLKGNANKGQVFKYYLVLIVLGVLVGAVIFLITQFLAIRAICVIIFGLWSLFMIVMWFYLLINVLRDTRLTLLSRFGINI